MSIKSIQLSEALDLASKNDKIIRIDGEFFSPLGFDNDGSICACALGASILIVCDAMNTKELPTEIVENENEIEANINNSRIDVILGKYLKNISSRIYPSEETLSKLQQVMNTFNFKETEDFLNAYEKSGVTLGFFTIFLNDDLKLEFAEMSNILRELEF